MSTSGAPFPPTARPRRAAGAEGARFGQDFVLLDAAGTTLRGLNPTAAAVWEACDGTRTAREIAAFVAERFGASLETVLPDVLAFLGQLAQRGLLETDPAPGALP